MQRAGWESGLERTGGRPVSLLQLTGQVVGTHSSDSVVRN